MMQKLVFSLPTGWVITLLFTAIAGKNPHQTIFVSLLKRFLWCLLSLFFAMAWGHQWGPKGKDREFGFGANWRFFDTCIHTKRRKLWQTQTKAWLNINYMNLSWLLWFFQEKATKKYEILLHFSFGKLEKQSMFHNSLNNFQLKNSNTLEQLFFIN